MLAALLKGEIRPSRNTPKVEEMANKSTLRQYSNRRAKKSDDEAGTSRTTRSAPVFPDEKEEELPPASDGRPKYGGRPKLEATKDKSPKVFTKVKPQVIVRKFTLHAPHAGPAADANNDIQKPKQRWKQLCNLAQEMITTIPASKMLPSELKRQVRSATLRSSTKQIDANSSNAKSESADNFDKPPTANKVTMNSSESNSRDALKVKTPTSNANNEDVSNLKKLLTANKPTVNSSVSNSTARNMITIKSVTSSTETEQTNVFPSQNNTIDLDVDDHPVGQCMTEVYGERITLPFPIDTLPSSSRATNSATNSSGISSPTIQTIATSPLKKTPQSVHRTVSSLNVEEVKSITSPMVVTTVNETNPPPLVSTTSTTKVIKAVSGCVSSPFIKNITSPSNKILVKNLTLPVLNKFPESPGINKSIVVSSQANSAPIVTTDAPVAGGEKSQSVSDAASEVTTDGVKVTRSRFGILGGKYVLVHHLPGNKIAIQDKSANKPPISTIVLQATSKPAVTEEKITSNPNSLSNPESSGSLLKATLLGAEVVKQIASAPQPITSESDSVRIVDNPPVLKMPNRTPTPPQMDLEEIEKLKGLEDVNTDILKKPMTLKQLQHEIALLKARQSIALQVEREVLRAKDVKVLREVFIPSRRVLLSDTGTQTNLFSLVEPGRMVEMVIDANKNAESTGMVSAKGKLGPGENSSGMQSQADLPSRQFGESASDRNCPSEEPDPKRPRLELNSRTALPDKLALDSSSDILRSDHLRNVNLLSLNSKLSEQSKAAGNTKGQAHGRGARSVDGKNSVFDIIVQHNIYSQSKPSPGGKSSPMVFIPESNSQNSRKNVNAGITRNVNHLDSSSSQNVNVQDTAARISELKGELFKDWSRCLIADNDGNVPLHHAVLNENLTLVKRQCSVLCARKVQVDLPNNDKRTPLHLAVIDGNADIVKALVDFGAKPDVKDQDGNTALHLAIIDGNLECLRVLLSVNNKNLPVDEFNDEGYAPLHLCALAGKVEESRLIINEGADVNLKDARSGRTSLFHAVESNNGDLVRLLLEFEASTNEPNFAGHTPLMAANEISFSGVASLYSPDVMNFNSKLVSLKSGQILEGGGNVIIRGDAIEDMEEVSDGVGMSFMPTNYKGLWKAGD